FPSAGIALVAVLVYGWPAAAAVLLASFGLNCWASPAGAGMLASVVVPAAIGTGAMLQALAGAALVRRFVRQPVTLTEPRDIAAFYGVGAFVDSLVSATISNEALGLAGTLSRGQMAFNWLAWCVRHSFGT